MLVKRMIEQRELTFERHRRRLFGLGYRMLGTAADAEDLVQDAYVRWHGAAGEEIQNAEAWLVATTTRLAIDRLRRLKAERAAYAGPWLPEPVAAPPPSPDHALDLASDLSMALLVLLERLSPDERAAFLLHDVFDCDYRDIARILGRTPAACRQVVSRARDRVLADRRRFASSHDDKARLLARFAAAVGARDHDTLLQLFTPDATWTADGGGQVPAAARVVVSAGKLARLVLALTREGTGRTFVPALVNGEPGLHLLKGGDHAGTLSVAVDGDRLAAVYIVLNPEKLRARLLA